MGSQLSVRWAVVCAATLWGTGAASEDLSTAAGQSEELAEGAVSEQGDVSAKTAQEQTLPAPEDRDGAQSTGEPEPVPVALTINGGVSLGAYEAGYLYYLTEFFKANPKAFETRVITGASAGTLNAVLTLLATVQPEPVPVAESLFFKIWTSEKMNYDNVMDIGDVPSLQGALSSRQSLSELVEEIRVVWEQVQV